MDAGNITENNFPLDKKKVVVHGHCHQKALSSLVPTKKILAACENFEVQVLPTGCCGMAGSFGYERRHYQTSMAIGEHKLFPAIRKTEAEVTIAANGTSCRHQIADGTGRQAIHPISILREALV